MEWFPRDFTLWSLKNWSPNSSEITLHILDWTPHPKINPGYGPVGTHIINLILSPPPKKNYNYAPRITVGTHFDNPSFPVLDARLKIASRCLLQTFKINEGEEALCTTF
uniref:Uncharacterized protein n=1 Tax=Cacopsylla melanoneura TaxID=428564 RepID=A0A8D9EL60_9HEMI